MENRSATHDHHVDIGNFLEGNHFRLLGERLKILISRFVDKFVLSFLIIFHQKSLSCSIIIISWMLVLHSDATWCCFSFFSFFFPKTNFYYIPCPGNSRNRSISFASPLHLLIMKIPVNKQTKKKITTSVVCAWVCVSVRGIPRLVFYISIQFLVNLTKGALETEQRFKLLAPFSPRPPWFFGWLSFFLKWC